MAGLNSTNSETSSHISMYTLLVPWQLVIVGAIIISVLIAMITAPAKHFRALVQPFVLRHVESGVPVILAIQVMSSLSSSKFLLKEGPSYLGLSSIKS